MFFFSSLLILPEEYICSSLLNTVNSIQASLLKDVPVGKLWPVKLVTVKGTDRTSLIL